MSNICGATAHGKERDWMHDRLSEPRERANLIVNLETAHAAYIAAKRALAEHVRKYGDRDNVKA